MLEVAEFGLLADLLVIFGVGVVVVAVLTRFGVPTIAGFILAGVLVGPRALRLVHDQHDVEMLAEIGVALLLFGIGLELPLGRLRSLWRPLVVGGFLQLSITLGVTVAAALAFGLPLPGALFLGFLMVVSSTAIVLRGLEARGEVEAPHGRLTLGILVFQDLAVVPMMVGVSMLSGESGGTPVWRTLLTAVAVLVGVLLAAAFVVPRFMTWIARTRQRDLFVLSVFLVCLGTAWIVSLAGISLALGAFLGGLVVAGGDFRHQAMAELIPFREILTSLFFVSVGMLLDPMVLWNEPLPVLAYLSVILLGKFHIVLLVGALMRLPARVSVLAGAALAQVGEFAFVLLHAAAKTPLLPPEVQQPLFPAIILSMLVTPVLLALGPRLAENSAKLDPLFKLVGVRNSLDAVAMSGGYRDHVIIAGFGLTGRELAFSLKTFDIPYVIVDLNTENVRAAIAQGEPAYFGDITKQDVLEHLGAERAREIVLVVNDPTAAERSLSAIRRVTTKAHVLVRSRFLADVDGLRRAGASEVIPAELEAALAVTDRVLARHGVSSEDRDAELDRIRAFGESAMEMLSRPAVRVSKPGG